MVVQPGVLVNYCWYILELFESLSDINNYSRGETGFVFIL